MISMIVFMVLTILELLGRSLSETLLFIAVIEMLFTVVIVAIRSEQ